MCGKYSALVQRGTGHPASRNGFQPGFRQASKSPQRKGVSSSTMPNLPDSVSEMFAKYAMESHILRVRENSANIGGPQL